MTFQSKKGSMDGGHRTQQKKDEDLEFEAEFSPLPPLIKPGKYEVEYIRSEQVYLFKKHKIILWFRICQLGTEYHGLELYLVCSKYKKFPPSSKFYKAWMIATGRKPERRDRINTKVFREKIFLANVRTVSSSYKGTAHPDNQRYSIIDELISIAAGSNHEC